MGIYYSVEAGYGFELADKFDLWDLREKFDAQAPEGVSLMTTGFDSDEVGYIVATDSYYWGEARDLPDTRAYDMANFSSYAAALEPLRAKYAKDPTAELRFFVGVSAG